MEGLPGLAGTRSIKSLSRCVESEFRPPLVIVEVQGGIMAGKSENGKVEIKLVNIHRTFQMGEVEVQVLRGIDAEIYKGEMTAVLGPSGSGKSTLLNMIGGIDRPTEGEVLVGGKNISRLTDLDLTDYRRTCVGFVFQFYNLVPSLTAMENVQVSTEVVEDFMAPAEALEKVGLGDKQDHFPSQLSGGQQQRVAIARALAKNPRIMLCDEPTGALDQETSRVVLELLQKLNGDLGTTIVMITHAPPISRMAHRVIQIASGQVEELRVNEKPAKVEELEW